jgi:hypothetical protein
MGKRGAYPTKHNFSNFTHICTTYLYDFLTNMCSFFTNLWINYHAKFVWIFVSLV